MPSVFYVVQIAPQPGRVGEAIEQLKSIQQVVSDAGAVQCRILQTTAGPAANTLSLATEWESMAAFEASREKVQSSPAFQAAQSNTNPPGVIAAQTIATEVP